MPQAPDDSADNQCFFTPHKLYKLWHHIAAPSAFLTERGKGSGHGVDDSRQRKQKQCFFIQPYRQIILRIVHVRTEGKRYQIPEPDVNAREKDGGQIVDPFTIFKTDAQHHGVFPAHGKPFFGNPSGKHMGDGREKHPKCHKALHFRGHIIPCFPFWNGQCKPCKGKSEGEHQIKDQAFFRFIHLPPPFLGKNARSRDKMHNR